MMCVAGAIFCMMLAFYGISNCKRFTNDGSALSLPLTTALSLSSGVLFGTLSCSMLANTYTMFGIAGGLCILGFMFVYFANFQANNPGLNATGTCFKVMAVIGGCGTLSAAALSFSSFDLHVDTATDATVDVMTNPAFAGGIACCIGFGAIGLGLFARFMYLCWENQGLS